MPLQANGPAPSSHPSEPGKTPNAPHPPSPLPPSTRWPRVSVPRHSSWRSPLRHSHTRRLLSPCLSWRCGICRDPSRARHAPTPCFLGRLTLPANLQITPSDERTGQRAEFVSPPSPPTLPLPLVTSFFFFILRRGK